MPRQNKATKAEMEQRINDCVDMILGQGIGWSTYTNWAMEKYAICRKAANNIWNQSWTKVEEITDKKNLIKVESLVTQLEQIIQDGDHSSKLKAIEQLRRLGGLDAPDKIEHSGNINFDFGENRLPVDPRDPWQKK